MSVQDECHYSWKTDPKGHKPNHMIATAAPLSPKPHEETINLPVTPPSQALNQSVAHLQHLRVVHIPILILSLLPPFLCGRRRCDLLLLPVARRLRLPVSHPAVAVLPATKQPQPLVHCPDPSTGQVADQGH